LQRVDSMKERSESMRATYNSPMFIFAMYVLLFEGKY
jgi:hypothetical protein